jgi:hypothetical protein
VNSFTPVPDITAPLRQLILPLQLYMIFR